ncbi:MAG: flagellar hook-basal body protein [Planctomycetota bacterium]|jgi:flagellar basal body rod protein FlgG
MNYGLYLSASGALTHMERQDVYSNNLANVNTIGFKPDMIYTRQRLPERLEGRVAIPPQRMLEILGGGLSPVGNRISSAQGGLKMTGHDLDVAVEGEGFLVVQAGPDAGDLRLTRDGRFTLNAAGELVSAANGLPVLDEQDLPIRLDRTLPVQIRPNGEIVQDDVVRARLRFVAPTDAHDLIKTGGNLLRLRDGTGPGELRAATGQLHQGHVESSAVDAIRTLMDLTAAAKAVMANGKMMQYHDHIMGQAVNSLGRVT